MLYKRGATISAAEGGVSSLFPLSFSLHAVETDALMSSLQCMAEVGVASSMAAGALTACMGGTPSQIMQAAEIGIEQCVFPPRSCLPTIELRLRLTRFMRQTRSSLGLTCDPIDGLVQVPCIERYAAKHPTFWIRQTHRRRRKLIQILILLWRVQELSRRRQSRNRCVSVPFQSGNLSCELANAGTLTRRISGPINAQPPNLHSRAKVSIRSRSMTRSRRCGLRRETCTLRTRYV